MVGRTLGLGLDKVSWVTEAGKGKEKIVRRRIRR